MCHRFIAVKLALALATLFAAGGSWAQPPARPRARSVNVDLMHDGVSRFKGTAQIGRLDVAEDNHINLVVHNRTSELITLGRESATCGCVKVVVGNRRIEAGESTNVLLQLRPGRDYSGKVWAQSISFDPRREGEDLVYDAITITLLADLMGVFTCAPEMMSLIAIESQQPGAEDAYLAEEVFIVATDPVELNNIQIQKSQALDNFDITLSGATDPKHTGKLLVRVRTKDIPVEGGHGQITLTDSRTSQQRQIIVSMIRRASVRIIPDTIVLQEEIVNDREWLVGFGMVIRDQAPEDNFEQEMPPVLSATANGQKLSLQTLNTSRLISRFKVALDPGQFEGVFEKEPLTKVQWDITWGKSRDQTHTRLMKPR